MLFIQKGVIFSIIAYDKGLFCFREYMIIEMIIDFADIRLQKKRLQSGKGFRPS